MGTMPGPRVIRPGRGLGMATARARGVVHHRVAFHGPGAHNAAEACGRWLERVARPGDAVAPLLSAWGPAEAAGALMVPLLYRRF